MIFNNNENIAVLNVELWLLPILILIILLFKVKNKNFRKPIIAFSIVYILALFYNFFNALTQSSIIFKPQFYIIKYPHGFIILLTIIFLIVNLFYSNKYFVLISFSLLTFIVFNQIYQRINTSTINIEFVNILDNQKKSNILNIQTDTTKHSYIYAYNFGCDSLLFDGYGIIKTITYTPYFDLKEDYFSNFEFPNYYWTKYLRLVRESKSDTIRNNVVLPKLIEKIKLQVTGNVKKYIVVYRIGKNGKLLKEPEFLSSLKFTNKEEYFNSINFTPAYLNNKPIEVSYFKKYFY